MKSKFKTPDPKKAKRYFSRKLAFTTGPVELSHWLKERKDLKVVDVRDSKTYAKGHIPGAVNLPREKWHKLSALDKSQTTVVYCYSQTCHLAARAALEFATSGFPVVELEGGFNAWKDAGFEAEKSSARRAKPASRKHAKDQDEAPALETEVETDATAPAETVSAVSETN